MEGRSADGQARPDGASAPQPEPAPQPLRYRVHHSFIWLNCLRAAIALVAVGCLSLAMTLAEGALGLSSKDVAASIVVSLVVVGCLLAVLVVLVIYYWVAYRHLYYELGAEEFDLYSGIVTRRRVHVPYGRVQSVDQQATLLQRLFGVCTVTIDTAGGAANKAVIVPYVRVAQAEQLRAELFARKQGAPVGANGLASVPDAPAADAPIRPSGGASAYRVGGNILDAAAGVWRRVRGVFGGAAQPTGEPVSFEYGLSNVELLLTGLSNNTAFFVVMLSVLGTIAQVSSTVATAVGLSDSLLDYAATAGLYVLAGGAVVTLFVVALAVLSAAVWLVSAVGACISYGGFRVRRRGRRIEVERGLLQHRVQGIDVDRVQYVRIEQGFIRRLAGFCEISIGKVDAHDAGDGRNQNLTDLNGVVIHPFARLEDVPDILSGLLPEFAGAPTSMTTPPPCALRRAVIRHGVLRGVGFWLAVAVAAVHIVAHAFLNSSELVDALVLSYVDSAAMVGYVVCVALFALNVAGAALWFRDTGFACNDRFMQVSTGGFSRETVCIPRGKIQQACVRANPLQRNDHVATIAADTAAGVGGTAFRVVDVRDEDAEAWLAWARPRPSVVE